jgi:CrcB protein
MHTSDEPGDAPIDPDVAWAAAQPTGRAHLGLRRRWDVLALVAVGGALGSVARWAVEVAVPHDPGRLPWSTWLVNVTGGLLLGALMVFVLDVGPPRRYVRPFLAVGVLGGYTTFSTYMLDVRTLLTRGEAATAFGYLVGTLVTGLLAVWAGVLLARLAVRARGRRRKRSRRDPRPDRAGRSRA